jgi:hypothetical protein
MDGGVSGASLPFVSVLRMIDFRTPRYLRLSTQTSPGRMDYLGGWSSGLRCGYRISALYPCRTMGLVPGCSIPTRFRCSRVGPEQQATGSWRTGP